ncbi:DOMON domain-containing protein FRRS1L [Lethenteron reissneri]|uniref:DOMON domain-containing protein FRRS1L n=1 Tax=Lethenteron reissneri TaxID=7753 RepID=UPI002AB6813E|nr:DOMON domain-containing protein FRRS1L [Lethenteron reissneri]
MASHLGPLLFSLPPPLPPPPLLLLLLWWRLTTQRAASSATGSAAGTPDSSRLQPRPASFSASDSAESSAAWPGGAGAGESSRNVSPGYNSAAGDTQQRQQDHPGQRQHEEEEQEDPARSSDPELLVGDPNFLPSLESLLLLGEDEQRNRHEDDKQDGEMMVMVMMEGGESDYGETVERHGERGDEGGRTEGDGKLEEQQGEEQEMQEEQEIEEEQEIQKGQEIQVELEFQEVQKYPENQEIEQEPEGQEIQVELEFQEVQKYPENQEIEQEPEGQEIQVELEFQEVQKYPENQEIEQEPEGQEIQVELEFQEVQKYPENQEIEQEPEGQEIQVELEFEEVQNYQEKQGIEEEQEIQRPREMQESQEIQEEQNNEQMELPPIAPWHGERLESHSFSSFTRELFSSHVIGEEDRPLPSPPPLDPFVPIRSDDCGIDKGCFRYGAPGCDADSCEYFLSYRRLGEDVEFELSADTDGWVGVGFSSDRLMGGDDVMACVHFNGHVRVQHYNNVGQWVREQPRNPARDDEAIYESGRVTCRFKRALAAHRNDAMVDLHLSWYYLLAWGPASHGLLTRHDMDTPPVTDSPVSVFRYEDVYMPSAAYQTCSSPGCLLVIVAITFYTLMGVP